MSQARLYLFGHPYLEGDVRADLGEDALMLLAYLALRANRPLNRSRIAFALWPDIPEADALRRLRQQLHSVRRHLTSLGLNESVLSNQGQHLRLVPEKGLWVDVVAFRELAGRSATYADAVALYRGNLMEPFPDISWLRAERAQLREIYLTLLRALVLEAQSDGDTEQALTWAHRLVMAAPWRESTHRLYMETLLALGRRSEAIQHYRFWEEALWREFGLVPAAETRELYHRMCQMAFGSTSCDTQHAATSARSLLVGREEAWSQLDEGLTSVEAGEGRVAFIVGENGLGRSYLVEQWLSAHSQKLLPITCECHTQTLQNIPAILLALRHAWHQLPTATLSKITPASAAIQRFLFDQTQNHSMPTPTQLGHFLMALARHSNLPLAIVLKDFHQADVFTWEAATFLTFRCARVPLYLLVTCPPSTHSERFAVFFRSSLALQHTLNISLSPLTRAQTAQLAARLLGCEPDPPFLDELYRVTEGYPYFIVAYVQAAQHQPDSGSLPDLPTPIAELMLECLSRVNASSQRLLALASRLPEEFTLASLSPYFSNLHEDERLEALEACLRCGLLVETPRGYRFAHIQLRRVARSLTSCSSSTP